MTLGVLKRHRGEVVTPQGGGGDQLCSRGRGWPRDSGFKLGAPGRGALVSEKEAVEAADCGGVEVRWAVVGVGGLERAGCLTWGLVQGVGHGVDSSRQMFVEPGYVHKLCVLGPGVTAGNQRHTKINSCPPGASVLHGGDTCERRCEVCVRGKMPGWAQVHARGKPGALRPQRGWGQGPP